MTADALDTFAHVHLAYGKEKTLILLPGTGGNEKDLIPLVEPLKEKYNIVGLRGNVLENGLPRFFARLAQGVFDQESVITESDKLSAFLKAWYAKYQIAANQVAFVGYSNGANMLLATLFHHPDTIHIAALLHSMLPFDPPGMDLSGSRFLVTQGLHDPLIPKAESDGVVQALKERGAEVTTFTHNGGHELTYEEQAAMLKFLDLL